MPCKPLASKMEAGHLERDQAHKDRGILLSHLHKECHLFLLLYNRNMTLARLSEPAFVGGESFLTSVFASSVPASSSCP